MTTIIAPYPYFTNANGTPLEGGRVYIGTAGLDPRTNPITVYQDKALTIPWSPIRTVGGYPAYQGAPSNFYTSAATYSIIVTTSTGAIVFRNLTAEGIDSTLRDDLAASSGAAMVGFLQSGTGAAARTVQSKLRDVVSVKDFGAVGDGITDDTAAIRAALASGAGQVTVPEGSYLVSSTITIPVYVTLIGTGRKSIILPSASGSFTANFVFMYNSTDGVNWTVSFPSMPAGGVRNLYFDNNAGPSTAKMIFSAGTVTFEDLQFLRTDQSIVTSGLYDDLITINRVFCRNPRSANWQIDVQNLGDGLTIQSVLLDRFGSSFNNHIRVRASQGGSIRQLIQGNVLLQGCDGVSVDNAHIEVGNITLTGSNATVSNSYIWGQATVPAIDVVSNGQNIVCKVENTSFAYNFNLGASSFFQQDIRLDMNSALVVDNCKRRPIGDNIETISDVGIRVFKADNTEITDFARYSNKLSLRGEVLRNYFVPLLLTYYGPDGVPNIFTSLSASSSLWLSPTATYFYRVVQVLDRKSQSGRADPTERSLALTQNGTGALLVVSMSNDCSLRIYRGTATGSYDAYVDLPVVNSRLIYDNGELLNGHPWIARAAAGVDTYFDATSIEIGNQNTRVTAAGASPSSGTWAVGDEFKRKAPVAASFIGSVCTVAGTPGTWVNYGATV